MWCVELRVRIGGTDSDGMEGQAENNTQLRELRNEVSDLKGKIELLKERCISALTENEMLKSLDRRTTSIMHDVKKLGSESTTSSSVHCDRICAKEKTSWADVKCTEDHGHQPDQTNKPSEKAGTEPDDAHTRSTEAPQHVDLPVRPNVRAP